MNYNATEIKVGGLNLKNPVLTAAGPVGFGSSYADFFELDSLGGLVLRTLTCEPYLGNEPPRLWETHSGILNNIGMQNPGLEVFKKGYYPNLERIDTNLIANIFGETVDEFKVLSEELNSLPDINALEINLYISHENYQKHRMEGYLAWVENVIHGVKDFTDLPIWAKISPNVGDLEAVALLSQKEGAQALTVANSYWGMAINPETRESQLSSLIGGLSGPAIKPLTLRLVWELNKLVDIPIIGVGGILSASDAIEFILAGASAVGIGAANFLDPCTVNNIIYGIHEYLEQHEIDNINELIGKLL